MTVATAAGLALHPFRAIRPTADPQRLGKLLCPPYDVIDEKQRAELLAGDPQNAVTVVLPRADNGLDAYQAAAQRLAEWVASGHYAADSQPALYVYEMSDGAQTTTRGLLGAVELRDPADGVILPHENTMAAPVADRLALMSATEANVEPIYLVYDGRGSASAAVRDAERLEPIAHASTPDGIRHRLWAITDPEMHRCIAEDLANRRALIADGHHRYATYRELQGRLDAERGPGPWDRGLTLLVDTSSYGPQVHAIHRVLTNLPLRAAVERLNGCAELVEVADAAAGLRSAETVHGFAAVLADTSRTVLVTDPGGRLAELAVRSGEPSALTNLDVTVLHRGLVEGSWGLPDTVETVGYAHSVDEAVSSAARSGGTAVLLRPTPVGAVAEVAAMGARMPRKSTLFTPKPASGLVMRRFRDEP